MTYGLSLTGTPTSQEPYLHLLWQSAFQHTQAERMMKQEDGRGAHTGSCEFGDGGARHYGICGHLRPQSKYIVLTTLVNDQKFCNMELNFFLFKKKS